MCFNTNYPSLICSRLTGPCPMTSINRIKNSLIILNLQDEELELLRPRFSRGHACVTARGGGCTVFTAGRARTATAVCMARAPSCWQQSRVSPKPLPPRRGFIDSWVVLFAQLIHQARGDSSAWGGLAVRLPAAPCSVRHRDVSDAASAPHRTPPSTSRLPPPCQILIVPALNFCKARFAKAPT